MNDLMLGSTVTAQVNKAGSMNFQQVADKLSEIGIKVSYDTKKQANYNKSMITGNRKQQE